jgi:hypothetical protein
MYRFWTKLVLVAAAIAFSVLIGMVLMGLAWPSPGDYATYWVFRPDEVGSSPNLAAVIYVHIGTDALCCFAILWAIYVLVSRAGRKKRRRE